MNHQINEWLREHRITEVECIVPDMTGIARGKIVPKDKFVPTRKCVCPRRC